MQITFPVTVWCYITLCPNSPVLPDHLSSHMRCQFGSNVQFLCNSLHRAMAAFSPVSPQCSCMDTDIDPDRIASVLKLANQISKSWVLVGHCKDSLILIELRSLLHRFVEHTLLLRVLRPLRSSMMPVPGQSDECGCHPSHFLQRKLKKIKKQGIYSCLAI